MPQHQQAYLVYDERMELHKDQAENSCQVERPKRVISIVEKLVALQSRLQRIPQLTEKEEKDAPSISRYSNYEVPFIVLKCEAASRETIELTHSSQYYNRLKDTASMTVEELKNLHTIDCTVEEGSNEDDEDMYFCKETFQAAELACGAVQVCVDAVTDPLSQTKRALAIVRPPGHHACEEKAMGFCFFNSVVVAAKHALKMQHAKKVVILDWDIHHGNGSQELTYNNPDILYISLHRYGKVCGEEFFPGTGRPNEVGGSEENTKAIGSNVNLAWTQAHMGNAEFATAMSELVLPLLRSFGADLVLISCGLDAAKGDPIGDCDLSPGMYHAMTSSILKTVGDVPFVVALEGGYNTDVTATCTEAVALATLDEKWDEDGMSCPTISSENGGVDHLRSGREVLSSVYNYYADDPRKRGKVKKCAIRDINKTIRLLRETPVWKDRVELREIPHQNPDPDQRVVTRRVTRFSKAKLEKEATENMELSTSFQSMAL